MIHSYYVPGRNGYTFHGRPSIVPLLFPLASLIWLLVFQIGRVFNSATVLGPQ